MNQLDPYTPPFANVESPQVSSPTSTGAWIGLLFSSPLIVLIGVSIVYMARANRLSSTPYLLIFGVPILVLILFSRWWSKLGYSLPIARFIIFGALQGFFLLGTFMVAALIGMWIDEKQIPHFTKSDFKPTLIALGVCILWSLFLGATVRLKARIWSKRKDRSGTPNP